MSTIDYSEFDAKLKDCLLKAFKFTIDLLNSHHLRWWACGGTMLGAVRHNNIIPWDDDIDIIMPRKDFDNLLLLKDDIKSQGYTLMSTDIDYYNVFAKICDDSTTILDTVTTPYLMGVFVDIFPIDRCVWDKNEYEKKYQVYKQRLDRFHKSFIHYSWRALCLDIKGRHPNAILNGLLSNFYNSKSQKENYFKAFLEVEHMFDMNEGNYMVSPTGVYETREFFRAEWFEEDIDVPFSDFNVKVPVGYDGYLKTMYGDYMQLPPVEKRITHHSQYYMNLRERVSMDEARKSAKSGIHYIY